MSLTALLLATACGSPTQPQRVADKSEPPPAPPAAPVLTPTHTLTMTSSASCTALPAAAMKRTYAAQVEEKSDTSIVVLVVSSTGGDLIGGWEGETPGFTGKRQGNTVLFDIVDRSGAPYWLIERIPGIGDMSYAGIATGTIDDEGNIVASFQGEYRLWGMGQVLCYAPDHRIELTRVRG